MLYQAFQNQMDLTEPLRSSAASALTLLNTLPGAAPKVASRRMAAALELVTRSKLTYRRPSYGIDKVMVGNRELAVIEEAACKTPFGTLLRFNRIGAPMQPKVLLVAPMSGHFATLLRNTVKTLAQDHDV